MKEHIVPIDAAEQRIDVTFFEQVATENTVVITAVGPGQVSSARIVVREDICQEKIDRITGLLTHARILCKPLDQQEGFQVHTEVGGTVVFPVSISRHVIDPGIHQGAGLFDQHSILIELTKDKHVPDPHHVDVGIGYPDGLAPHPGNGIPEDLVQQGPTGG